MVVLGGGAVSYERGTPVRENVRIPEKGGRASGMQARCQRELFIDNLLVRIHFIIVMIRWTGLAPWEFEFPFPGSLTSSLLVLGPMPFSCSRAGVAGQIRQL